MLSPCISLSLSLSLGELEFTEHGGHKKKLLRAKSSLFVDGGGGNGGGGVGFFLAWKDFGRMFDNSFPAYASFLFFSFLFF